jgi:phosphoribosylanthranilate isomerase
VRVEVKICGLTRPADAAVAVAAGASYLGVVYAGGPRAVNPVQARAIVLAGAPLPVLGVFAGQTVEEILRVCHAAGLAGAQLHGAHVHADAARLRRAGLLVWRVVRLGSEPPGPTVSAAAEDADAVLIEPWVKRQLGGTGQALDLEQAGAARAALAGHRMVLAGGLTPESVGAAIRRVGPDIVDVSSGVESAPGRKDAIRIRDFLEAVIGYDAPA